MGLRQIDKAILKHQDTLAKFVNCGVSKEMIIDKLNAFDWLELQQAETEIEMGAIIMRFFEMFKIQTKPAFKSIILKSFTHKFIEAINEIKEAIEFVNGSYNIDGSSRGFQNDTVNKFYYINYWAEKKLIPVNYNEKEQKKRDIFNFDTIILSILADKLNVFNEYERTKAKR